MSHRIQQSDKRQHQHDARQRRSPLPCEILGKPPRRRGDADRAEHRRHRTAKRPYRKQQQPKRDRHEDIVEPGQQPELLLVGTRRALPVRPRENYQPLARRRIKDA